MSIFFVLCDLLLLLFAFNNKKYQLTCKSDETEQAQHANFNIVLLYYIENLTICS